MVGGESLNWIRTASEYVALTSVRPGALGHQCLLLLNAYVIKASRRLDSSVDQRRMLTVALDSAFSAHLTHALLVSSFLLKSTLRVATRTVYCALSGSAKATSLVAPGQAGGRKHDTEFGKAFKYSHWYVKLRTFKGYSNSSKIYNSATVLLSSASLLGVKVLRSRMFSQIRDHSSPRATRVSSILSADACA